MRFHRIFVLSILAAIPLVGLATPHSPPRWDGMRSKHSWSAVPEDWEYSGHPPTGTTIDLYVALRPHREDALIQALYEVSTPGNPKYVVSTTPFLTAFSHACTHVSRRSVADIVRIYPGSRSLSSSLRIQTLSSLSTPGSSTAACLPLPSQSHTVAAR
jgi:hypothetical protein